MQELVIRSHFTPVSSTTMTVQSSNTVEREKRRKKTPFTMETCKYTQILYTLVPSFSYTLHWGRGKGRLLYFNNTPLPHSTSTPLPPSLPVCVSAPSVTMSRPSSVHSRSSKGLILSTTSQNTVSLTRRSCPTIGGCMTMWTGMRMMK